LRITAGVVPVVMCADNVPDGLIGNRLDERRYLRVVRREHVVDEHYTFGGDAYRHRIAAGTENRVQTGLYHLDCEWRLRRLSLTLALPSLTLCRLLSMNNRD
jgi:hypothetical protein